ncbi:DUF2157 domain-containing protein [Ancylobacter terrae]|uniref:DUF2157 domain-containing protein n=1 Tax=Ancylobacter sp. sgz301288 TaxID=3342077 RepID=UPI00385D1F07
MKDDAADRPGALDTIRLDRAAIDRLAARGLIPAAARDHALALIGPPRRWGLWAGRLIGTVGAALVLAGLIYFFAFNWNAIPPMVKLGAIGGLFATACLAAAALGFGRPAGDGAATAAVVLVGVFLAVTGQIYQTGADAWTLFAAWAGLTFALALIAASAAAWAVWIAVAAVALFTFWDQTQPADATFHAGRNLALMALFGSALLLREMLARGGYAVAGGHWTRFYLGLTLLGVAAQLAFLLLDEFHGSGRLEGLALAVIPLLLLVMAGAYRFAIPDVAMLTAVILTVCAIGDFALFRAVSAGARRPDVGTYFLMGLATLALFALAVAWLRSMARRMEGHAP